MELTRNELILYSTIAGIVVGFVCGLILLMLGIKRGQTKFGIVAFFATTLSGAALGVVSLVVGGVFLWWMLKKPAGQSPVDGRSPEDESIPTNGETPQNS